MGDHLSNEQLVGYVHHTLTDAERETMIEHLQACALCRTGLADREALQRRIRYSLSADMRAVSPSSAMSFAAIAPRVRRRTVWDSLRLPSGQFLPGATALAAIAGLAVAVVAVSQSVGWSSASSGSESVQRLPVLACGCFALSVIGHYPWKSLPSLHSTMTRLLAFALWLGTALLGLEAIVAALVVLMGLLDSARPSLGSAFGVAALIPLGIAWIAVVVGGGEYHYHRVGQRSSWQLFGWTVAAELLILLLPYILGS